MCSPKKKVSALGPEVGEDNALDNVLHDDTADPYAVAASDNKMPPSFLLLEPATSLLRKLFDRPYQLLLLIVS